MDATRVINLMARTEGRDKAVKALGGLSRILFSFNGNKKTEQLAASMSEGRTLMRLLLWVTNVQKMQAILSSGGVTSIQYLEVVRIFLDFVFCVHDNLAYLTKYKILNGTPRETLAYRGLVGMMWGFLAACVMDILALAKMRKEVGGDESAYRKRKLMLVRNTCDLLASLAQVGYIKSFSLGHRGLGVLALISGAIATKENWDSTKK